MTERQTSQRGVEYLKRRLKVKPRVVTDACLWDIPHNTRPPETNLKIGRYKRLDATPDVGDPKSELTLDGEELEALLKFLEENIAPFRAGEKRWLSIGDGIESQQIEQLQGFFASPDKRQLLDLLVEHDVLPDDLVLGLQYRRRLRAIKAFETMLRDDLVEHEWQRWFEQNDWVLGSEFVRILEERSIDVENIGTI